MRSAFRYALAGALAVLLGPAAAAIGGATLHVPAEYPTIQAAIDAAQDGDTVQVAAGVYYERLVWDAKSIKLIGAGADVTTVDAACASPDYGSCLAMTNVLGGARVEGFTFTGGLATAGAGGLDLRNSSAIVANNVIGDNRGSDGGVFLWYSSATLTNNVIVGNCGNGGGVRLWYSSATLTNNVIADNYGWDFGGGLCILSSTATLEGNEIAGNYCLFGGGGLYALWSSVTLVDNTISGNRGVNDPGGGLCLERSSGTVIGNTIAANTIASSEAAGVFLFEFSGTLAKNTIVGNGAEDGGGGLVMYDSPVTLTNNTIAGNVGVGLFNYGSNPVITNCTIACNLGGPGLRNYLGSPAITNCILWGNDWVDLLGASAAYSCIGTGEVEGEGNTSADPMFADPAGGDFRLQAGSPCIDAGTIWAPALPLTDADGNPRILGAAVDMGAYEFDWGLGALRKLIQDSVAAGEVSSELEQSLLAHVDAAIDALARGNRNDAKVAMNLLAALVREVEAQDGSKIAAATADEIILRANDIIAALGD